MLDFWTLLVITFVVGILVMGAYAAAVVLTAIRCVLRAYATARGRGYAGRRGVMQDKAERKKVHNWHHGEE